MYKLTYRQNGQTKTTGIEAAGAPEARDKAYAFIQDNNLPLRRKDFFRNPALSRLVSLEAVPA